MVGLILNFIYDVVLYYVISGLVNKLIIVDKMQGIPHLAVQAENVLHL